MPRGTCITGNCGILAFCRHGLSAGLFSPLERRIFQRDLYLLTGVYQIPPQTLLCCRALLTPPPPPSLDSNRHTPTANSLSRHTTTTHNESLPLRNTSRFYERAHAFLRLISNQQLFLFPASRLPLHLDALRLHPCCSRAFTSYSRLDHDF